MGTVLTDPKEINARFMEFYSNLYKSNGNRDTDAIKSFLSELNLPHLIGEAIADLDKDISMEEIIKAISESPNNKAP